MSNLKKIVPINVLKSISSKKRVALAHGVFDVFHIGHLRHLEVAKKNSDVLVVSITSDKYVKKGPMRPYFSQSLRAEFLSSLDIVDYIYINDDITPINLINIIKPKLYVKGKDYENHKEDITGNILREKKAIEKNGGKLLITDEVEFSSSKIINKFLQPNLAINSSFVNIDKVRDDCIKAINDLGNLRVLVIGEIIFDEYNFVKELDKPGKENIQSVLFEKKEVYLGGSFSIARNLSSLVEYVEIFAIGNFNKDQKKILQNESLKIKNLKLNLTTNKFQSILKKRYVNNLNKKLFEEYILNGKSHFNDKKFLKKINKLNNYDIVILADFGHGFFSKAIIEQIAKKANFFSVNVQTNSENRGFNLITKYKKADYICIDRQELRLAMANRYSNIAVLIKDLFKKIRVKTITITMGKEGVQIAKKEKKLIHTFSLNGFETNPVDTMGAGDAVFGISSLLVRNKVNIKVIALISNLVGALKTKIIGHSSSINKQDIIKSLTYTLK